MSGAMKRQYSDVATVNCDPMDAVVEMSDAVDFASLNESMTGRVARGAMIVVEGVDRSGKTTQCSKLTKRLIEEGLNADLVKFPVRESETGNVINNYLEHRWKLDDRAIHLLFSANRWEVAAAMKRKLLDGTTFIVDRYAFSGVAYSSAKPGMSLHWCMQPQPDAVIYLNIDSEAASQRAAYGKERYECVVFQQRVADIFAQLKSSYWKWIDVTDREVDDIHDEMYRIAIEVIRNVGDKELGHLWTEL